MINPPETHRSSRIDEQVIGRGRRDAARTPSQLDRPLGSVVPIHGDSVKGSFRHEKTHSAARLPQLKVIVGGDPHQTTHRVALVGAQGGVEIAPHRFEGHRASEWGAPLVPDGIAPAALTMVGLSAFAGRIDRGAAHRPLLTRERLGRGEEIIGWDRHRFI